MQYDNQIEWGFQPGSFPNHRTLITGINSEKRLNRAWRAKEVHENLHRIALTVFLHDEWCIRVFFAFPYKKITVTQETLMALIHWGGNNPQVIMTEVMDKLGFHYLFSKQDNSSFPQGDYFLTVLRKNDPINRTL